MEYTIADATGSTRLAVWEENVGVLKQEQSYHLSCAKVAMYRQQKHPSFGMNAKYEEITVIGDVTDIDALPAESERSSFTNVKTIVGTVDAIEHIKVYSGCTRCKSKLHPKTCDAGHCFFIAFLEPYTFVPFDLFVLSSSWALHLSQNAPQSKTCVTIIFMLSLFGHSCFTNAK